MTIERAAISTESEIREGLLRRHGELLTGKALRQCLGFGSVRSFQRAVTEGALPVITFTLPGRRGRFARTRDVAAWLATLGALPPSP
ncbi:hypothetical protein FHY13_003132 [Xanthomonas arboricola]|uniref:hypothetical protein n=1 Tax=Xanthomonas euroxanthea TaxID=2259622 RepID=UPI00160C88C5|nr:hypothetical protein [Xanthomonas euroxanthea]MBB3814761.1 hypothetical protein [Xanthomonas euroxanthea]